MPVEPHKIASLPLFSGLTTTEIEEIASHLTVTQTRAGEPIMREGDPPGHPIYILLAGSVEVLKRGVDGRTHVISSLSAPSVFGEIEILAHRPASAGVTAVTDVQAALLMRGVFDELCAANRECILKMVRNLAQVLSHRLAATDERLAAHFDVAVPGLGEKLGQVRHLLYSSWRL